MNLQRYYDHRRGYIFQTGQLITVDVEWLDTLGTGFEHDNFQGILKSIIIEVENGVNTMVFNCGIKLTTMNAYAEIELLNGEVNRYYLSSCTPDHLPTTKRERNKIFNLLSRKGYIPKDFHKVPYQYEYLVNIYNLHSTKFTSETEANNEYYQAARFKTDNYPESDGKIPLCRTDNPLRGSLNMN